MLKRLKTAIIILLIVFVVSFVALAIRIVYVSFFEKQEATAVVPDNIIAAKIDTSKFNIASNTGLSCAQEKLCEKPTEPEIALLSAKSAQATVVELYLGQSADNDAFHATNMFPGDIVTKYYCLKVYHKTDITVYFNVTDLIETNSLGAVLNIKVTKFLEDGSGEQLVYDGSFYGANGNTYSTTFSASPDQETIAYYKIEVSLPTSAGNEYQRASLSAKLNWYAQAPETSDPTPPLHVCDHKCPVCGKCQDPSCTHPTCSEKCECAPLAEKPSSSYRIWPWTILPAVSLTSLIPLVIIFFKKKKEGGNE